MTAVAEAELPVVSLTCAWCGRPIPVASAGAGGPRRYCDSTCRVRAHRGRSRAGRQASPTLPTASPAGWPAPPPGRPPSLPNAAAAAVRPVTVATEPASPARQASAAIRVRPPPGRPRNLAGELAGHGYKVNPSPDPGQCAIIRISDMAECWLAAPHQYSDLHICDRHYKALTWQAT